MEAVSQKTDCTKCGAEVREGTAFCYACGAPVGDTSVEIATGPQKTVSTTGENGTSAASETSEDKLSKAREERKKARVGQRRPVEYTWEPNEDSRLVLFAAILITAAVAAVVAAMVFWK